MLLALRRQAQRATEGGAFRSFPRGMATLVAALEAALPAGTVRLGTAAERLRLEDRTWKVHTSQGETMDADVLLLAAPAPVVGRLAA